MNDEQLLYNTKKLFCTSMPTDLLLHHGRYLVNLLQRLAAAGGTCGHRFPLLSNVIKLIFPVWRVTSGSGVKFADLSAFEEQMVS